MQTCMHIAAYTAKAHHVCLPYRRRALDTPHQNRPSCNNNKEILNDYGTLSSLAGIEGNNDRSYFCAARRGCKWPVQMANCSTKSKVPLNGCESMIPSSVFPSMTMKQEKKKKRRCGDVTLGVCP
jgi:hypothetical protein